MNYFEKFYRAALFSVCAALGILAITVAVLGPEWKNYYKLKAATIQSEKSNEKITQLLTDHQDLINLIKSDPNVLMRLAPVELGIDPNDPNTISAKITKDSLLKAKAVLEQADDQTYAELVPNWLVRATLYSSRIILFSAGAGLILVAFVCFSGRTEPAKKS